jgi:hypothetical protein
MGIGDRRAMTERATTTGEPEEWELVARSHQTKEDIPRNGISIDATAPISHVVAEIVREAKQIGER